MTNESTTNAPSHIVYVVKNAGEMSFWNRIGVAWAHKDGKGFNADLDCLPIDGKITLRVATEAKS